MILRLQRGSPIPISRQIDAQIRAQILAGVLKPTDQLPSVRHLARELAVNVNTVLRVYERLASEGLIELRHGDGTYVAPQRKGDLTSQLAVRRGDVAKEFDTLVRSSLMLGLTPAELQQLLAESIDRATADTAAKASHPQKI